MICSMSLSAHPYQPSGIRVTLENADLWQSFHSIGTEMIITKHGRRMFPHCSVRVSRLQPFTNYVITMDIVPVDGFKYKHWEIAGAADPHPPCRTYTHPDSPAPGRHWMKQPLSFPKLKLTNNTLDQHGHIILLSMHRYYPRFHVVQADNPYTLRWGSVQSFSFPETAFTAVTAYQNPKVQICQKQSITFKFLCRTSFLFNRILQCQFNCLFLEVTFQAQLWSRLRIYTLSPWCCGSTTAAVMNRWCLLPCHTNHTGLILKITSIV
uniref:T-box domain-containing protein n=1 Tax=Astatotilapia calliptera TaxID=8154 RepID=A0AAX7SXI2_ASTCA